MKYDFLIIFELFNLIRTIANYQFRRKKYFFYFKYWLLEYFLQFCILRAFYLKIYNRLHSKILIIV